MKAELISKLKAGWCILTEVPGWPDAPFGARFVRSLPIVIPTIAIIGIAVWDLAYYAPKRAEQRALIAPLAQLEQEISALQIASSEQQVAELAVRSATASRLLVDATDVPALFKELKAAAAAKGWDATFVRGEVAEEAPGDAPSGIMYLPVRAKFRAQPGNTDRFSSFLTFLDQLSSGGKRIDLTRVAIRADESHWQTVEANLRLVSATSHAKSP